MPFTQVSGIFVSRSEHNAGVGSAQPSLYDQTTSNPHMFGLLFPADFRCPSDVAESKVEGQDGRSGAFETGMSNRTCAADFSDQSEDKQRLEASGGSKGAKPLWLLPATRQRGSQGSIAPLVAAGNPTP